jgi:hypothetical protein
MVASLSPDHRGQGSPSPARSLVVPVPRDAAAPTSDHRTRSDGKLPPPGHDQDLLVPQAACPDPNFSNENRTWSSRSALLDCPLFLHYTTYAMTYRCGNGAVPIGAGLGVGTRGEGNDGHWRPCSIPRTTEGRAEQTGDFPDSRVEQTRAHLSDVDPVRNDDLGG